MQSIAYKVTTKLELRKIDRLGERTPFFAKARLRRGKVLFF